MSYGLNSIKESKVKGSIGDDTIQGLVFRCLGSLKGNYIGDYYRGFYGGY